MEEQDYPEHIKVSGIKNYSQVIGEFLEWQQSQGLVIAKYNQDGYLVPSFKTIQDLLAEFFEIDQNKLEEERKQMLYAITAQQAENLYIDQQILREAKASTAIDRDGDGQTIALGQVTVGETIEKSD